MRFVHFSASVYIIPWDSSFYKKFMKKLKIMGKFIQKLLKLILKVVYQYQLQN